MSKHKEMRAEYRQEDLGEGVRGKYLTRFQKHSNVIVLDEDIAAAFPNSQSVNEALRGLLRLAQRTDA